MGKVRGWMDGVKCPQCGQTEEIFMYGENWASLTEDGTAPQSDRVHNAGLGGLHFNNKSQASCPFCGYDGTFADFVSSFGFSAYLTQA